MNVNDFLSKCKGPIIVPCVTLASLYVVQTEDVCCKLMQGRTNRYKSDCTIYFISYSIYSSIMAYLPPIILFETCE